MARCVPTAAAFSSPQSRAFPSPLLSVVWPVPVSVFRNFRSAPLLTTLLPLLILLPLEFLLTANSAEEIDDHKCHPSFMGATGVTRTQTDFGKNGGFTVFL